MIIYPARHWFEALRPTLEPKEKEIFYQHPTLPIKINQIGIVYFEDEDSVFEGMRGVAYRIRMKRKNDINWSYVSIGTRARACYESYYNVVCPGRQFLFIDGNPLNCTMENLVPTLAPSKVKDPEGYALYSKANKATKRFVNASVEWMMEKEEWVIKKGGSVVHYWELWGELPAWLQTARIKRQAFPPGLFAKSSSPRIYGETISEEEKNKITQLYLSGMSHKNIAEALGYREAKKVQFMVRKLRLSRR